MSGGSSEHVDEDGHVEDGIPRMRERLLPKEVPAHVQLFLPPSKLRAPSSQSLSPER